MSSICIEANGNNPPFYITFPNPARSIPYQFSHRTIPQAIHPKQNFSKQDNPLMLYVLLGIGLAIIRNFKSSGILVARLPKLHESPCQSFTCTSVSMIFTVGINEANTPSSNQLSYQKDNSHLLKLWHQSWN